VKPKLAICLLLPMWLAAGGCVLGEPFVEGSARVRVTTTLGEFVVELDEQNAPLTAQNFVQYVNDGFYNGTLFHRVVPGFVVQAGGYLPGLAEKETRAPIVSEANNGLQNVRGTVGMARLDDPDSAASQFYINLDDNAALDATLTAPGYTVFGVVMAGMDVVDQIAAVPTETRDGFEDVPVEDVVILSTVVEPGERVLSPEWDAYLQGYQYNALSILRQFVVDGLGRAFGG